MDPLDLSIALVPLAVYLLVMGWGNAARRPRVSTAGRDAAALGLAMVGFVIIGPMQLFFPERAATEFGGGWFVWLLLLCLYGLGLLLVMLMMRPRLIVYNATAGQLRAALSRAVQQLDEQATWTADSLVLPTLGVQFHLETHPSTRTAQLVSSGPRQNFRGWRELDRALREELRAEAAGPLNPFGLLLTATAVIMLLVVAAAVVRDPQTLAQGLQDFLE